VPGIRRSLSGPRPDDSPPAVPGTRTRDAENGLGRNGGRAVLENVPHTLRGCMGTFSRVAILGKRVTEKRATATKQAAETPGGGRRRSNTRIVTRHRRAASRSGGATRAKRDGRPVNRRNGPRDSGSDRISVSRQRVHPPRPRTPDTAIGHGAGH
jgi:hypothetical protein